jgi:hypothetical protein
MRAMLLTTMTPSHADRPLLVLHVETTVVAFLFLVTVLLPK